MSIINKEFIMSFTATGRSIPPLVFSCGTLESDIKFSISTIDRLVNGKSILGLLSLGWNKGDTITAHLSSSNEDTVQKDIIALEKIIKELGKDFKV